MTLISALKRGCFCLSLLSAAASSASGQSEFVQGTSTDETRDAPNAAETVTDESAATVLSQDQWQQVEESVDKALNWLSAQQRPDGSFPTIEMGQPGVTSLCIMAFMAHGHLPGEGQHGERLQRATEYTLGSQKDNGRR
jgi:hypothetical protein